MSQSIRRIIQNTGFLYVRMLVTLGIMLYTSRILLDTLGADDYGLYHVLAGIVVLLGFLQGALSTSTQRFIAVELGRNQTSELAKIFSMSVNIHLLFGLILAVLAVGVGYFWLLELVNFGNNSPSIVVLVFLFSIATFVMNLLALPCHAVVISHEHMKAFAWFGILEAVLKLAVVLALPYLALQALLTYAILLFVLSMALTASYFVFVWLKFPALRYQLYWDSKWFGTLVSFSGWTIWGSAASVFANQGTNLLLNVFFGPAVNAAKSIGTQASGALSQFVTNLQSAINPQLIKSYSADDLGYTDKLVYYGAKYNFFLILMLAFPVLVYTDEILGFWLVEVPDYASLFLRILLVTVIIESISKPLITAAQATGNIKLYQLVVGGILLLNIPLSYVALRYGFGPESVFYVALTVVIMSSFARVLMLKRIYSFSVRRFLTEVIWPITKVSFLTVGVAIVLEKWMSTHTFPLVVLACLLLMIVVFTSVVIVGLSARERSAFKKLTTRFNEFKG
ncbi:MATE family efflux transporter [Pseudidiomarina salilacus]|uniref:hypothetical protein n=1 Tax=Pseudidiomarina salilacus TaxID=3384452 RepID=UPI0039856A72